MFRAMTKAETRQIINMIKKGSSRADVLETIDTMTHGTHREEKTKIETIEKAVCKLQDKVHDLEKREGKLTKRVDQLEENLVRIVEANELYNGK